MGCMRRIVMGFPAMTRDLASLNLSNEFRAQHWNRSSEGILSAEQFFPTAASPALKTIATVRASHGESITPQLIIDSMGGDTDKIFDGNTVGQYIEG